MINLSFGKYRNLVEDGPRGVMVKAMECGIVVREFVLQLTTTFTFGQIPLGKV